MARWKYGSDGQLYYDTQDSGPDQGTPTPEQQAAQGQSSTPSAQQPLDTSAFEGAMLQRDPNSPWGNQPGSQDTGIAYIPPGTQPVPVSGSAATTGGAMPIGFDADKWNDPNKHDPKYDAGHMLANGATLEQVGQYIQSTYPGYKYLGGDKIQGPDGAIYDDSFGSGAGINRPQWTLVSDPNAPASSAPASASITGSLGANSQPLGGSMSANGSSFGGYGSQLSGLFGGQVDSLYNILMQRAGQSLTPSAQDPIIANQVNAYSAQQQRAARDYIDDLAESRGPISNIQGEKRLAAEKIGQSVGSYQAALMQHEIDARRQEIQNALNGAIGFLTEEQRQALQRELAYLDMSQRAYEFDVNDEFRRSPLAS